MHNSVIYVHYEPLAHMFMTAGISASDVLAGSPQAFAHLLLLPPIDDATLIDPHTGFNEIDGRDAIAAFLRSKNARNRNWLDFKHAEYLQELTPTEIAELLYLGHAKTHIQPPFYYKLQDNLVYLPLRNGMVTLYFRSLVTFAQTFAAAIVKHLRWAANDQPFWLRLRQQPFPTPPRALLMKLLPMLEDGTLLDFGHGIFSRDAVRIPLLLMTDRFIPEREEDQETGAQLGELVLQRSAKRWRLVLK